MWSVSVHMCRLNQRHNLLFVLFFWSSLLYFSNSGAVAAVSDFEIQPSNDIDQELLLTREEKLAFDKVGRENVMHGFCCILIVSLIITFTNVKPIFISNYLINNTSLKLQCIRISLIHF